MRASRHLLAIALLSACTDAGDEDWMPPEPAEGKADGIDQLSGADIPSAHVDAGRRYLRNRTINGLVAVKALDPAHAELARRADGILANLPLDGRLHVAELVKLEQPEIFGSLFPAEQAALPDLWKLLEAPDDQFSVTLPAFPAAVTEVLPGPVVLPTSVVIASRPLQADQAALQRLQLQFNVDSDPATASLVDLSAAISDTVGRYTPAEIGIFNRTRLDIATMRMQVPAGVAKAILPPLGRTTALATMLGTARLEAATNVYVLEQSHTCNGDTTNLATLVREFGAQVAVPNTEFVFVLDATERWGTSQDLALGRDSIVETWKNGTRTSSTRVSVPGKPANIGINDVFGFRFEDGNGQELPRVGKPDAVPCSGNGNVARYSAWTGMPQQPGTSANPGLAGTGIRITNYGHYELPAAGGPLTLQVFEGKLTPVVFFTHQGVRRRATYRPYVNSELAFVAGVSNEQIAQGQRPRMVFIQTGGSIAAGSARIASHTTPGATLKIFHVTGLDRLD